jgi:hypothetical protein
VSPKERFQALVEPQQMAVLREIERRTGARLSELVRRAIDLYISTQTVLTKEEVKKLQKL